METSDGWERVRKLAPVVVVQSRVRLGEERNRAKVAVDFSEFFCCCWCRNCGRKLTGRWIVILVNVLDNCCGD
jgi:hypothetical protein